MIVIDGYDAFGPSLCEDAEHFIIANTLLCGKT